MPFMWVSDEERESLPRQIQIIYESGAKALCVESRTHRFFCKKEWWEDMKIILDEAKRLGMKVWLLDDKHFPSGYACGRAAEKYPHLTKRHLVEHHVDVMGPVKDGAIILNPMFSDDELLGVYMYKRSGNGEEMCGEPIVLTECVANRYVYVDVPDGCHRIFCYYKSKKGTKEKHRDYINIIDEHAVKVQLEAVYESLLEHFADYFGDTFVGFFTDEPSFTNDFFDAATPNPGMKSKTLGLPGLALPWSDELLQQLIDRYGDGLKYLCALWFDYQDVSSEFRFFYMNTLTNLYSKNYSRQIGDWCRAHNVMFIGHIIEDMSAHSRLGCSCGHYFRSMDGQDMSGMDIVLHQVMPGFAHHMSSAAGSHGVVSPDFFHYSLAQLCSSMAQLNPNLKRRAMCEMFGAYGWAEGVPMMKWLVDHLLVRGINHFVPHAFSYKFPNDDCPPHFYADGNDPQFLGYCKLMGYTNRMSHLIYNSVSTAKIAVLYHGEAEWMNTCDCMLMQKVGKMLTDANIAFEYLPFDYIERFSTRKNKRMQINEVEFRCVLVPYAKRLPDNMTKTFTEMSATGIDVFMVVEEFDEPITALNTLPLSSMLDKMVDLNLRDITIDNDCGLLRVSHYKRDSADIYMVFNENLKPQIDAQVSLPHKGRCIYADFLNEEYHQINIVDKLKISLSPYESKVLIFDKFDNGHFADYTQYKEVWEPDLSWEVYLKEEGIDKEYIHYKKMSNKFENITRDNPNFSGRVMYKTTLNIKKRSRRLTIDFGEVWHTCELCINGHDMGVKIAPPYTFDITDVLIDGDNDIEVVVANTLVHRMRDYFSSYMLIPPTGIVGPVKIKT